MNQTVRQYLVELEQQNPTDEPVHEQKLGVHHDPDATYGTKGGTHAEKKKVPPLPSSQGALVERSV